MTSAPPQPDAAPSAVAPLGGWRDWAAAAALVALPLLLFHGVLDLWWADDDLEMLRFLRGHPGAAYVWSPTVWRSLPGSVLTPLQFLSLHLDLALFGMTPRPFYAHQLLALGAAAGCSFLALRLWMGRALAFAGVALFLCGRPVASLAAMVPARHYAEAIACGALAVFFFHRSVARSARAAAVVSAGWSLAAMGFKETAVPLPLLLAVLPVGTARERRRALVPQTAAWLAYAAYRLFMLGPELLKGYGFKLVGAELPRHLLVLPGRAVELFVAPGAAGVVALALLAAGLGALALLAPRRLPLALLAGALALGPVVPVSVELSERYVVTFWLAAVVASVAGLLTLARRGRSGRRAAAALAAAAVVACFLAGRRAWDRVETLARRSDAESRALLRLGDGDVLRGPIAMAAFLGELQRYRTAELGISGNPAWFEDDLALCLGHYADRRLWQYEPVLGEVVDVSDRRTELRAAACARERPGAPLGARFELHAEDVAWELVAGPGSFALVLDDGVRAIEVPARGAFHLPRAIPLRLRVRYTSPEGWVTYSDEIGLTGRVGERIDWHRP